MEVARFAAPVLRRVKLEEGRIVELDIPLIPGACATLRVVDGDGAAVAHTDIRIGQPDGEWATGRFEETDDGYSMSILITDSEGRVKVGPIVPGRWPVELDLEDADGKTTHEPIGEIVVAAGQNPEITLRRR